jgi:hypothetical protein
VLFPTSLTIVDGAVASDGGSIALRGVTPADEDLHFHLDWSLDAQARNTTQLSVNGMPVPKGSPEEAAWLALIRNAEIPSIHVEPQSEESRQALRHLADELVELVSSPLYHFGPPVQHGELSVPLKNRLASLLTEGKRREAIQLYRQYHRGVGILQAAKDVEAIASDTAPS